VKVLVTGGSGLLGSHVITALRARGDSVRALARGPARALVEGLGAEVVEGDLLSPEAWTRARAGVDGIVHAAALVTQPGTYETYRAINVGGTERALAAATAARVPLVHISSVAVYGRDAAFGEGAGRVGEDFPFQPIPDYDTYARTKREAELLVRQRAETDGLQVIAIRPTVVFGERDRNFSPRVAAVLRRGILPRVGRGDNRLSLVYAGNVAAAIVAALDRAQPGFRVYNTTNDSDLTQREFFAALAAALGVRPIPITVPAGLARFAGRVGRAMALLASGPSPGLRRTVGFLTGENPYRSDRARDELGWRPVVAPLEAIARTAAWLRKNERPG
jgi:nucleoside-diphosphate-sugar epimerase